MEPAPLFGYLTGARWAPTYILQATSTRTDPTCAGNNGTITTNVTGGMPPYSYLWSNGATTPNLTGLAAGYYSVVVTDATGATAQCFETLSAFLRIEALIIQVTGVRCSGDATGSVTLQKVGGGSGNYTFLWSNGATTQNLSGVPAGTYTLTITDSNGCTGTASATVPAAVSLLTTATRTDVGCGGSATGSISLAVSGGASPYLFRWSNGATTQNLSGLMAGTYTVTVTDASGCTSTAGATILEPAALRLSVASPRPSCFGGSTGGVGAAVSGGTSPYTYLWSNGATTASLTGVAGGAYSVTVTDARGCTATGSATVTESTQITALASKTDATCYDARNGTITLAVSGGMAPLAYMWSNGATTQNLSGLAPGTYTVAVTDANGCTATSSTSLLAASCREQHCTLTQGGYGNSNGIICKEPSKRRLELIADMFTSSNLVLGAPGRSLTYSYSGGSSTAASLARQATAQCIIDKMPAGGSAAAFPSSLGNASGCAGSFPSGFLRNGRFNNVLVGQTLALSLNLRLDNTLAGVPLSATMTSYATLNCSSPDPRDLTGISRSMPAAVLGNLYYGSGTPTVGSLLDLANKALGGLAYANGGGNPSLSDINSAVAGINELFDDCRIFNGAPTAFASKTAGVASSKANLTPTMSAATGEVGALAAFPNPFTAATTLSFALPETAKYSLTVYDLKGSEVARVSSGEAQAGVRYRFAVGNGLQEGVYVARLVTATGTQTIRLNLLH